MEVAGTLRAMADLKEWIRNMGTTCYAVCTGYSPEYDEEDGETNWFCEGLIFTQALRPLEEEECSPSDLSERELPLEYLVKYTKFSMIRDGALQADDLAASDKVNWVVL